MDRGVGGEAEGYFYGRFANPTTAAFEAERTAGAGMGPGFIRISAGLEDPEDVIADLAQALQKA